MAKVLKTLLNALIIGLLLAILYMLVQGQVASGYSSGAPLMVNAGPSLAKQPASLFDLQNNLECTAGPAEKAAWYSRGLTPGGLCGDGQYVQAQMRDYAIAGGVGGSLLEK